MKLKNFIVESFEKEVKTFFKVEGKLSQTEEGIVVDGNLLLQSNKSLTKIPWKIAEVTGEFSMENSKLASLENFPDRADTILITGCQNLTSLRGGENIVCAVFDASNTGISDLEGCPSAEEFLFRRCPNLTSTKGLNTSQPIKSIQLDKSFNLTDIGDLTNKIAAIKTAESTINLNPSGAFLKLLLLSGRPGYLDFNFKFEDNNDDNLKRFYSKMKPIFTEYKGKSLSHAIELMRAFHDQGGDISTF